MVRNTSYLKKLRPIIDNLSDKYSIKGDDLEELLDNFFLNLKKYITDPKMPTIKILNFGTYKPTVGRIDFVLKSLFRAYKRNSNIGIKLRELITRIWPIKQRLIDEMRFKITWNCWKNNDTVADCYEKCIKHAETKDKSTS